MVLFWTILGKKIIHNLNITSCEGTFSALWAVESSTENVARIFFKVIMHTNVRLLDSKLFLS